MTKAVAQKQQLIRARDFLGRTLLAPEDEIQRAATIQAFEFCFELAWKYLKTLVEEDDGMVASPKAVFREAAKHGIIDNPSDWFNFLDSRNLTVHTYIEVVADKVYRVVKNDFVGALNKLIETTD
ncbi:MAG TPA: HI0074 family nucleotidyltransferase substrate-binding subunit [Candidatus Dormibacteraeota bacterium]|nr:HI0074 family nucleotidyltransferase substrate-binding subunit [Candidatus Dormibacteraeota bacterium]